MRKYFAAFIILSLGLHFALHAQNNTLRGKILGEGNQPLPGAHIVIEDTNSGVHSNEKGEYLLTQLPEGRIMLLASFVGYETYRAAIQIQPGENIHNVVFARQDIRIDNITVTSQKRDQQVLDVPITMSVIDANFMESHNITGIQQLSQFVPGLLIRMQGTDRPTFVMRGLSSDEVSPSAQPRVSVFYNNVPISRMSGASVELFDMQQVDVLKGPQESLFGRNAQIGAVHYISNKPVNEFGGFINAGTGSYAKRELSGAINLPVIQDKLFVRAAGAYDYRDGYIRNTFGDNLNGKNTIAGRLSLRFLASENHRFDLVTNYQKDDDPGLGFISMVYPNTDGSTNPFDYTTSLEQGNNLATSKNIFDATISSRHYFNPNNYLSTITSYRSVNAFSRWDGDGTAAPAIDMSEDSGAKQFYEELRLNYSWRNRFTGSLGLSYWHEKATQDYWFSPNDQHMFHLFFNSGFLVTPAGQPYPVSVLPNDPRLGPLAAMPLGTNHQESSNNRAVNQALEGFWDTSYKLSENLSLSGGIRVIQEWFELSNEAGMIGGAPSVLGMLTGNYPNLFFKPSEQKTVKESGLALTGRIGLQYSLNENHNFYGFYSRGRRPTVLQFTSTGDAQVLEPEILNSYEIGLKSAISHQLWLDAGVFYHDYMNFQTTAWVADASTGEFNYIVKDAGKASAYGLETGLKYAVLKGLQLFGNYNYIHARFANTDTDGEEQAYAGNRFRLTPDHSFALGCNGRVRLNKNVSLFAVPSYSYNSKIFFEDANTDGLEQDGYGLFNFRGGIELPVQKLTLAFWSENLLGKEYIVSAGNTGSLFGAPTLIPGPPRMLGVKLNWKF